MNVPAYQLDKLSFAFKVASLIVAILSGVIYFYANINDPYIQQFIDNIRNNSQSIHTYFGDDIPDDFLNFLQCFNKDKITNLANILVWPYTISIAVAALVIEIVKNKHTKKRELALENIMAMYENNSKLDTNSELLEYMIKVFLYYGGDINRIKLIEKVHKN